MSQKERPILFSKPMVSAILAGTKTQTRRVVKPQPIMRGDDDCVIEYGKQRHSGPVDYLVKHILPTYGSPYGQPGDRLWVRENGWERPERTPRMMREGADTWPPYEYDAEPVTCCPAEDLRAWGWKRRPSIHMPRWASRILLEVTAVRVERLQDISEADAKAEGITGPHNVGYPAYRVPDDSKPRYSNAVSAYAALWSSINGFDSWEADPWVWVVEFKRVQP